MSTVAAPSVIGQARAVIREVMTAAWPDSREAMHAIGYARRSYADEAAVHDRLAGDDMSWREFDPDLEFFAGDPQEQAISIAADRALDAARAALRTLREHQRREAAMAAYANGGAS